MLSCFLSVDEDLSLLIDTLEVELHQFPLGCGKLLAILTFAALEPASASASGSCRWVRCVINVPIVGEIYSDGFPVAGKLPVAIKERLCLCFCRHPKSQDSCNRCHAADGYFLHRVVFLVEGKLIKVGIATCFLGGIAEEGKLRSHEEAAPVEAELVV